MYDNGEGENIALLLFGKGERGKRRIRTTAPMAQRNWFRILPEVKRLVAQGLSIKPATRRVAKEVHLRGRIAPRGAARAQVPRSAARRVPVSGCAASSRQPLAAASAESEGPFWPINRRERVCVSWGGGFIHALSSPVP